MDKELHRKVQIKQMEIMDEIHSICVNNNLRYYLIGGSCLGAVRHKGFIPWDVDIDIAMPRKDYDLFFNVHYKLLSNKYEIRTYKTDEVFIKPHGLVCLKNSKLLTKADIYDNQLPNYGIFIDVMPLDKCPSDIHSQKKHKAMYLRYKKLKKIKLSRIYESNNILERYIKHIIRLIMSPLSMTQLNKWQEDVMKRYNQLEHEEYWCSIGSRYSYEKQLMKKSIYGTPKLAQFEDRYFFIPEQPDKYLAQLFGDYTKTPSIEVQERMYNYFYTAEW